MNTRRPCVCVQHRYRNDGVVNPSDSKTTGRRGVCSATHGYNDLFSTEKLLSSSSNRNRTVIYSLLQTVKDYVLLSNGRGNI